ncbi:hypothetical protein J6590_103481 [Homalodisca vitripennis]|nr:hypothetical protein J6590_103481 [Homalodisca vitripennis]
MLTTNKRLLAAMQQKALNRNFKLVRRAGKEVHVIDGAELKLVEDSSPFEGPDVQKNSSPDIVPVFESIEQVGSLRILLASRSSYSIDRSCL